MNRKKTKYVIESLRLNGFEVYSSSTDRGRAYHVTNEGHEWNLWNNELEAFWWGIRAIADLKDIEINVSNWDD